MTLTHLTDFSDRISPMLVKELRQGMRAKTFIVVFLALQVFLAVMLFSAGASSTSDQVGSVISSIIFTFFSIAVLVIQPLRGTSALASEVKGNTIDMMVLTRLSAWRIVFGKWVAIVSQSALLLTTIIPYLILRYFFGGMNLVAEMTALFLLFLTSMGLTAVTVGLSGCTSAIIRYLPVIGLLVLTWMFLRARIMWGGGSSGPMDYLSMDNTESRIGVATYIVTVIYLGFTMLSLGASLIAPAAENHAFPRRLVAVLLILFLLGLSIFDMIPFWVLMTCVSIVVVPTISASLTDSSMLVPTVCKPFIKRGIVGRALGWFCYPSWESGVIYAIAIALLALVCVFSPEILNHTGHTRNMFRYNEESVVLFSLLGSLFFPAVWQVFFFRGENQRLAHYLLLQVGSFVMLGVLSILADTMDSSGFLWVFGWHPLAFIAMLTEHTTSRDTILAGVIVVDLVMVFILLIRAGMEIKRSASIIQETRDNLETNG